MKVVLDTLLIPGERIVVMAKVGEEVKRGHAQNVQQGMVDQYFPLADLVGSK